MALCLVDSKLSKHSSYYLSFAWCQEILNPTQRSTTLYK